MLSLTLGESDGQSKGVCGHSNLVQWIADQRLLLNPPSTAAVHDMLRYAQGNSASSQALFIDKLM
jgi:hypothetical protein